MSVYLNCFVCNVCIILVKAIDHDEVAVMNDPEPWQQFTHRLHRLSSIRLKLTKLMGSTRNGVTKFELSKPIIVTETYFQSDDQGTADFETAKFVRTQYH